MTILKNCCLKLQKRKAAKKNLPPTLPVCLYILLRAVFKTCASAVKWSVVTVWGYLRHYPNHAACNILFLAAISLLLITGSKVHDQLLLSRISDSLIESLIHSSKYTRDYRSADASTRGVQLFLRVGAPRWTQKESIKAVLFHARRAGLSLLHQAVLLATVEVESGFNPMARAPTTSACGLFQFVRATGIAFGLSQAECMDPWLNAKAGVKHYIRNYQEKVEKRVTGFTGPELLFATFEHTYYLHHDGINSTNPSPEVKAVVLGGTQFLFKAYEVLLSEAEREEAERASSSFTSEFAETFWDSVQRVSNFFHGTSGMLLGERLSGFDAGAPGVQIFGPQEEPNIEAYPEKPELDADLQL